MSLEDEIKIKKIIARQQGIEMDMIKGESYLINDLGMDSLDATELMMEIEEKYRISIKDTDASKMKTVGDVIKYVEEHGDGKNYPKEA